MPSTPEPTIVVGVFDDAAGAERATRALQQARFPASDVGVEPGDEGRALVGSSGLLGALRGMGVPEPEAHLYDQQHRAGSTIVTVSAGARRAETEAILRQSGAVALEELGARGRATSTRAGSAEMTTPAADETRMPLVEEQLVANTRLVEIGAVVLRKEIVTDTRLVEVQVRREQLVVERRAADSGPASRPSDPPDDGPEDLLAARFRALQPGESIRLDLVEDEVVVQRRPVVYQEVVIGKQLVRDTRRISSQVRREQARIESVDHVSANAADQPSTGDSADA
jgi:stress response protein YsnF